MSAIEHNRQVSLMLDYYLNFKSGPKYALMIKGPWGSGKSHFLKNYFQERNTQNKNQDKKILDSLIWVSLYGMNNAVAIDEEIFRQVHPLLGSKAARLTGRFLMAGLKLGVKLPDDITLTGNAPNINANDFAKNYDVDRVLVFDDLERCGMPISEALGYINNFVELGSSKVIVIANDDEIINSTSADRAQYIRIKEKLIGTTVQIEPDVESAFAEFADEAKEPFDQIIKDHQEIAVSTYRQSGFGNLRSLRHAILDFTHLLEGLDPSIINCKPLLSQLMERFVAMSAEIRAGKLNPDHIPFCKVPASLPQEGDITEDNAIKAFQRKFLTMDFSEPLLEREVWKCIFGFGLFDNKKINKSLLQSRYFLNNETEIWLRLWHFKSLSETDYQTIVEKSYQAIKTKKIRCLGEIKHIVALLMYLSEHGAFNRTQEEIAELGRALIDDLLIENELSDQAEVFYSDPLGWKGFEFISGADHFNKFSNYIDKIIDKAHRIARPKTVRKLLELMQKDMPAFVKSIVPGNHEGDRLAELPLARFVNADDFLTAAMSLKEDGPLKLSSAIEERYRKNATALFKDRVWLKRFMPILDLHLEKQKGKLAYFRLIPIREALDQAIHDADQGSQAYHERRRRLGF